MRQDQFPTRFSCGFQPTGVTILLSSSAGRRQERDKAAGWLARLNDLSPRTLQQVGQKGNERFVAVGMSNDRRRLRKKKKQKKRESIGGSKPLINKNILVSKTLRSQTTENTASALSAQESRRSFSREAYLNGESVDRSASPSSVIAGGQSGLPKKKSNLGEAKSTADQEASSALFVYSMCEHSGVS